VKTGISFLFSVLLLNSLFYYCYFSCSVLHAKIETMLAISAMDKRGEGDIVRIAVDKSAKYESDEIWYQEKLYDVLKRESVNDTNYLYLLQDKEEERLLMDNSEYFNNLTSLSAGNNFRFPHSSRFIAFPDFKYLLTQEQRLNLFVLNTDSQAVKYKFSVITFPADVPTPPPRNPFRYKS
jgi:hypothetical protein